MIWGRISALSQLKNEQKLPKVASITPNFLIFNFDKNFMKNGTKIAKLQKHENLHKNVNESFTQIYAFIHIFMQIFMFYEGQIWYSYILFLSYMVFNQFKIVVKFKFSQIWWSKCLFPQFNKSQSQLQKEGKSLHPRIIPMKFWCNST